MNIYLFELATEAYKTCNHIPDLKIPRQFVERFAELVAAEEREACAKVCEMLDVENPKGKSWDEGTLDCATAIRARGQA
jgi:hypothetical protein